MAVGPTDEIIENRKLISRKKKIASAKFSNKKNF